MDLDALEHELRTREADYHRLMEPYERMREQSIPRLGHDDYSIVDLYREEGAMLDQLRQEPAWATIEAFVLQLCRDYVAAPAAEREQVRALVRAKPGIRAVLLDIAACRVRDLHRAAAVALLREGIAAIVVENFTIDPRESLVTLQDLYLAAQQAGLDPGAEFVRSAAVAGSRIAAYLTEFAAHPDLEEARARAGQSG